MHHKRSNYTFEQHDIIPLNIPVSKNDILKNQALYINDIDVKETIKKIANQNKKEAIHDKDGVPDEHIFFDLEAEIKSHPDSLFVKCFAIKANEMNDNGDYFPKDELRNATATFVGVPVFTNHQNTDINQARGKVVHSWWDEDKNGIMVIMRVDSVAYPQLARAISEKYATGTSMGCLTPDCRVLMHDGTYLPIKDVQPGDKVITHTGKIKNVLNNQMRYKNETLYQIKHSNFILKITHNHPILTIKRFNRPTSNNYSSEDFEWREISKINVDDVVVFPQQHSNKKQEYDVVVGPYLCRKISSIQPFVYTGVVHNLQVEEDNSYISEGAVVKNCQVKYSICSVCHNLAEIPSQYCDCIKERKTRQITAKKQKCSYHKHGKDAKCPICESTKESSSKVFDYEGKVFEYNYGIKFIENSLVVTPACHDCGVTEIIDQSKFIAKVAELNSVLPGLLKKAIETPIICSDTTCVRLASQEQAKIINDALVFVNKGKEYIEKVAGQEQINDLNQALNLLTSVSSDMLKQKDQLDLEFLSDLVKVLADLQEVTDELTEQGYGRLPSPGQQGNTQPTQNNPQSTPQPTAQPPANTSKVQSGPAGNVGTATGPLAAKRINLQKLSQNIMLSKIPHKTLILSHAIKEYEQKSNRKLIIDFNLRRK